MNWRKGLALALGLLMSISLFGCGSTGTAVYVQSVSALGNMGGIAPGDRFAGIVVSENVAEITKDEDKVIDTVFVKAGDDVTEGQELFSYDTEQLQLNLDKQKLELAQLEATIENYKAQIKELESERNRAPSGDKLQYTIQIQTTQLDLKEAELNLSAKKTEVAQAENILENATVVSPFTGRVQAVNENGYDNYGNPLPYITIQQSGSYRVKGILGELQMGALMEGTQLKIISRTDETASWTGTISLIDYENPSQGNDYDMYYGMPSNEMTAASKYPFYVELENTEGLILGQHVYMELAVQEEAPAGLTISSAFICYADDGSAYVWAENRGKLEQRTISLGEYNMMNDTFIVLEGLSEEDYIAFPDPELCVEGAPTSHEAVASDDAGAIMPMPEVEVVG